MTKKRTITPEHLAAMQAGKQKAKKHRERVAQLSELDGRLSEAAREANRPVKMTTRKRRKRYV